MWKSCFVCGYGVIKRKYVLTIIQRKKLNHNKRLKYAEHNFFCICIDGCKSYQGNHFGKIYEALSKLENKKIKTNKNLLWLLNVSLLVINRNIK